jgi:hypothetical protein
MRYFFILLLFSFALLGLVLWYRQLSEQRSQRLTALLQQLESRYARFIKQRLTLAYIQESAWQNEREKLIEDALEVLKPTLDALAAQVSGASYGLRDLRFDSAIFNNVAATAEALSQQRATARPHARADLHEAFRDAMRADLATRWLEYQTGDRLSPQ